MCLGIPGQVAEITDAARLLAAVTVDGSRREVSLAMIGLEGPDGARVGDWVIVHLGFAMAKVEEAEARQTLDALGALGDMYEQALAGPPDDRAVVQGRTVSGSPPG